MAVVKIGTMRVAMGLGRVNVSMLMPCTGRAIRIGVLTSVPVGRAALIDIIINVFMVMMTVVVPMPMGVFLCFMIMFVFMGFEVENPQRGCHDADGYEMREADVFVEDAPCDGQPK